MHIHNKKDTRDQHDSSPDHERHLDSAGFLLFVIQ